MFWFLCDRNPQIPRVDITLFKYRRHFNKRETKRRPILRKRSPRRLRSPLGDQSPCPAKAYTRFGTAQAQHVYCFLAALTTALEKICVHLLDANIRLRPLHHILIFNIFKLKLSYFRTRDAVQSMCVQVIICGNVGSVKEKESVWERFRIKLVNASIIEVGLKYTLFFYKNYFYKNHQAQILKN